jgi:pSer/pThr/pTyr-binding forkhead associated (FHA) protein
MPASPAADRYTVSIKNGDYVFREGDAGTELFLVEEGRVELSSSAAPEYVETLDVGDFFGTASLISSGPREISARAVAPCRLVRIDRPTFVEVVRSQPDIALLMLRRVAERMAREDTGPVAAVGQLVHVKSGKAFPLDGVDFGIGRSSKAAGIVPDIDLTDLDPDKTLSRRHARLTRTAAGFVIREEEGRNGTFVNGDRLAAGQQVTLEEGDRVRFGLVELVFRLK